jgi:hypothetical protein
VLPPAQPTTILTTTTSRQIVSGACVIVGWSFVEPTNAAPAAFELWDGTSAAGDIITTITLVTNESTRDLVGVQGLLVENGVYLSVLSGTVRGSLWFVTVDRLSTVHPLLQDAQAWGTI